MILKKYLFIALMCTFLTGQTIKGMEAWALDKKNETQTFQQRNIIVEYLDENEKTLFSVEMPHDALLLSKTLTNVLGDSDETTDTITISALRLDFSPKSLQSMLLLIKEFWQNKSAMLFIDLISQVTSNELLELVNASSYLSCEKLHKYLITTLMIHMRSSINDIPSLTQALEFAQMLENTDHIEHLLVFAPRKNQINYFQKNQTIIAGHDKRISALCYSPDSTFFATASWDQTIKIWDAATNSCIKRLANNENPIYALALSSDATKLISITEDGLKIWEINTGSLLHTIENDELSNTASFSPLNNNHIVFGADNSIFVFPNYLEDTIYELNGHTDTVCQVIFSPQGDLIASASDDKTIKLWNTSNYNCEHTFEGHENTINTICFSHDGKLLASTGIDGIIKIWNLSSKQCIQTFQGHISCINSLCFSPDNSILASGGDDHLIKLWDVASWKCISILQSSDVVNTIDFAPNGLQLLTIGSRNNNIELYLFHDIKKEFSLATMLLVEYIMKMQEQNTLQQLPSTPLYFDLFTQLPVAFQNYFINLIDQNDLKAYLNNKQ